MFHGLVKWGKVQEHHTLAWEKLVVNIFTLDLDLSRVYPRYMQVDEFQELD